MAFCLRRPVTSNVGGFNVMVKQDFARWALGFSGCDGGNLSGCVWLCGLEYGGDHTPESLTFRDEPTPSAIQRGDVGFLKYQYNWKAVKLLAALRGKSCTQYREFFCDQACFAKESDYFKLNLYPIAFKNTSHQRWQQWLCEKTGFATKQEYLEWCRQHRFEQLRRWSNEYSPRLIICTGITRATEFQLAFGAQDQAVQETWAGSKRIRYFTTNNGKTLVAIIYFLGGRYGLKSDEELQATGTALRTLVLNTVPRSSYHGPGR